MESYLKGAGLGTGKLRDMDPIDNQSIKFWDIDAKEVKCKLHVRSSYS